MGGVEVGHHQVKGGLLGFDLIASLQNDMCPRPEFENSEIVTSGDGSHTEADHERVRVSQAVGREADVTDPHRGSEIRIGQSRLHVGDRTGRSVAPRAPAAGARAIEPRRQNITTSGWTAARGVSRSALF